MKTILKKMPLFSEVELSTLDEWMEKRQIFAKSYSKGKTLYNQHDPSNTLDIVRSGSLISYSLSQNGSATTMFTFKENDILGANLLFREQTNYPLSIYCLTDCELIHIAKDAVLALLHNYHFSTQYIRLLSQNSQGMNERITMITQKTFVPISSSI